MATMTDKAAEKIAEQTVRKYEAAGRQIAVVHELSDGALSCTLSDGDKYEAAIMLMTVARKAIGDDDYITLAKATIKETKKEKKHGPKH